MATIVKSPSRPATASRVSPGAAPTTSAAPLVLVVEDDADNQALLQTVLRREGYRVIVTADGASALDELRANAPDLVLLDVGLPGMDGYEVTRRIRLDQHFATLPVLLLTGRTDPTDVVTGLDAGADDFIRKPFGRAELVARIRSALRLRRALVGMEAAHSVVAALANAVEAKDAQTEHHCERLALSAGHLGMRLRLPAEELDALMYGALLHDVGKIGVPDAVLQKAGPLTDSEWELIRRHPTIGQRICAPIQSFALFGPIIRQHHERWDGGGYPDGVRGEAIAVGARIVGIVDAFDAMTHDRPYRAALSRATAIHEITRLAGRQFDPEMARLFVDEIGGIIPAASDESKTGSISLVPLRVRPAPLVLLPRGSER